MNNLVKTMSKKLKGKKGFTLIEMLIVVAIIAILVAIAVPVVNSSMDKARKSTDDANLRAAESAALSEYIAADKTGAVNYIYLTDGTAVEQTQGGDEMKGQSSDNQTKHIVITVTDGKVDGGWVAK